MEGSKAQPPSPFGLRRARGLRIAQAGFVLSAPESMAEMLAFLDRISRK
jgi:hypothetical protein